MEGKRKVVRLNETQLRSLIRESVRRIVLNKKNEYPGLTNSTMSAEDVCKKMSDIISDYIDETDSEEVKEVLMRLQEEIENIWAVY